jgi:hypothetical protein
VGWYRFGLRGRVRTPAEQFQLNQQNEARRQVPRVRVYPCTGERPVATFPSVEVKRHLGFTYWINRRRDN